MANFKDLTDQRFGRLVVIKQNGTDKWSNAIWICLCDCGKTVEILARYIKRRGDVKYAKSCGCLRREVKDLMISQRFGRLVVIKQNENDKWGKTSWLCLCDCGKTVGVLPRSLRSGSTKSCGCLRRELNWQDIDKNTDFAFTATQLRGMKLDAVYKEDLKV